MMIFGLLAVLSVGMMAFASGGDDSGTEEPTPDQPPVEEDDGVVEAPVAPTDGSTPPPEALLLATDIDGNALPDGNYLSDGPVDGENADRDYVVAAPADGASHINIEYNAETTFLVELGPGLSALHASLNSDITGANPTGVQTGQETVIIDDEPVVQITESEVYESATQIVINVSQEQIGSHVAQIDLTNPNDAVYFEFDPNVIGNLHLITNEIEIDDAQGSTTQSTMYIVETPPEIQALSPDQIAQIIAQDGSADTNTTLVAEVYLGEESVVVDGNVMTITDFMNENPFLGANMAWASEGVHDGSPAATEPAPVQGGTGGTGGTGGGLTPSPDPQPVLDTPTTTPDEPDGLIIDLINDDLGGIPPLDLTGLEDLTPEDIQELQDLADSLDLGSIPTIGGLGGLGGLGL